MTQRRPFPVKLTVSRFGGAVRCIAALGACWAWGPSVAFAEPPVRAELRVAAASGCVSAASISERVHARSSHVELVDHAQAVPVLLVAADADEPRGWRAQLRVVWPDGRRSERQLEARSCREVGDVLAFLIVLTLDPSAATAAADEARAAQRKDKSARGVAGLPSGSRRERAKEGTRTSALPPGASESASPPSAPAAPSVPTVARVVPSEPAHPNDESAAGSGTQAADAHVGAAANAHVGAAADAHVGAAGSHAASASAQAADAHVGAAAASASAGAPSSSSQPPAAARDVSATAPRPAHDRRAWYDLDRIEWGLLTQLLFGAAPTAMPGLGLQVLVALRGEGLLVPALQLRATRQWLSGWTATYGVADFELDSVRLDVCPLAARLGFLTGRACLETGAGSFSARGRETYAPRTRSRAWADSGATLALSAELGRFWQVGVNVGLVLPWRRDRFAFRPEEFHRVAALCWTGDLRIGLRFP